MIRSFSFHLVLLSLAPQLLHLSPGGSVWLRSQAPSSGRQLLKICCYPVYGKLILRLAMLKELMETVMMCQKKKKPLVSVSHKKKCSPSISTYSSYTALKCSGFISFQLKMLNVFAATRGRRRCLWWVSGLQNSVCNWQECRRALGLCTELDLLDLNPHTAAGLNASALGERVERDDKQFWLGHAWKYFYSYLYYPKLRARISACWWEIQ